MGTSTDDLVKTKSTATQTEPEQQPTAEKHSSSHNDHYSDSTVGYEGSGSDGGSDHDSDSTVAYEGSDGHGSSTSEYTDEYEMDPEYDGPPSQSVACFNVRGHSYTPPGWKKVTKKRRHSYKYRGYYAAKKRVQFD